MITKDNVRYLTDDEVKLGHSEYIRRKRGGKQEIKPIQVEPGLDIFKPV